MNSSLRVVRTLLLGCVGLLGVAVLLLIALFALALWSFTCGAPSSEGLQHKIERDIPVGSPLTDIQDWLATEGRKRRIEGSCDELSLASQDSVLRDMGIPGDAQVCSALLPGNPGLTIDFVLDEDMRFQQVVVERYYVLP